MTEEHRNRESMASSRFPAEASQRGVHPAAVRLARGSRLRTPLGPRVRAALVALLIAPLLACEDHRPSFLLFVLDTVRHDDVSAYSPGFDTTPNLDGLAREGLLYTRSFSQAPWTLPSHVSMFTGLLPSQHGVGWHSFQTPDSLETLAERLAAAGYQTLGVTENPFISRAFKLDQGFEEYFFARRPNAPNVVEVVEQWLENSRRRGPYFVFVNVTDAHSPYTGGPECDLLPRGVSMTAALAVSSAPKDHMCVAEPEAREMQILKALHRCALRVADNKLGDVYTRLSSSSPKLISIVTSDHGDHFGEHQLVNHQFSLRNELLHVPLVVHGLAGSAPGRIDHPVQIADIAPSILSWAGIDLPPGLAARPLPTSNEGDAERVIIAEYADYESLRADTLPGRAMLRFAKDMRRFCDDQDRVFGEMRTVVRYPYKVIRYDKYSTELFDISVDPTESRDLSDSRPALARELLSQLPPIGPPSPDSSGEIVDGPTQERSPETSGDLNGSLQPIRAPVPES